MGDVGQAGPKAQWTRRRHAKKKLTDQELYEHRFAMAMHEPNIDKLKHELTAEQWDKWEKFYEQDPWGELRQDLRFLSAVLHILNPQTETSMIHPYFESHDDVDDETRYQQLQAELAAIGPEKIQEALKKGREKYLAEKAKRG